MNRLINDTIQFEVNYVLNTQGDNIRNNFIRLYNKAVETHSDQAAVGRYTLSDNSQGYYDIIIMNQRLPSDLEIRNIVVNSIQTRVAQIVNERASRPFGNEPVIRRNNNNNMGFEGLNFHGGKKSKKSRNQKRKSRTRSNRY